VRSLPQHLSPADISALKAFLASPTRPEGTLSFHELQGFLFTIASSPESVPPSEWIAFIGNDEDIGFVDENEAQQILNLIMGLYNEVNESVLERSEALPAGCEFETDTLANFDEAAPISQWSRGFMIGHDWLDEVWDEYLPEELDEECGANTMALSFFSSRQLAEAYYDEFKPSENGQQKSSFKDFAEVARELFPSALSAYAHLGRTIFEVLLQNAGAGNEPIRTIKVGRNDPCPCGSGRKYKQCCGGMLQ
jgi:yecA family protein